MSDDIVTRLRDRLEESFCHCVDDPFFVCSYCAIEEAADEIERLRAKYDRLLNHIQLVAQSPDSRLARDILIYYYPLSQNGVGTSITLKWVDDEAVRGE